MHSAPAVSYPVGRSYLQITLIGFCAVLGLITGVLWSGQLLWSNWRLWLFGASLLVVLALALSDWQGTASGHLCWDGQGWCWASANTRMVGRVSVHLDLQSFLLLSLRSDTGQRQWLWPEQRTEVARWRALRWALFSRPLSAS